ncbi:uncharacterized protein NPIL_530931 [Nephila pilipes]|uniref:Uncharacterized protein n=1 Tax=Nephila pilipes TaxID=299642 RepID=A0A8X6PVR6_NEPPI|nr:uncharacterized protein NPIL_530931 [Nephila pilipes]
MFDESDELLLEMLVMKLKGGGWKSLDERINTPVIAIAAVNEYLKALPRCLWSGTKPENWRALSAILLDMDLNRNIEKKYSEDSRMEAFKIFESLKSDVRHFSAKLMMTLHEVITRCDDDLQAAAAQRLSELFATSFIRNSEKSIEQSPLTLQRCVAYLIEEAPCIFGSEDAPMRMLPMSANINYQKLEDNSQPHRTFLV